MTALPDAVKTWLDGTEYMTIATVQPDGQPQLSVVWGARDGDTVLVSTLEGRQKFKNLSRDPRATILLYPKDNPGTYAEIRGTVEFASEGAPELIQQLSQQYFGAPYTYDGPDDVRVTLRITPEKVIFRG